MMKKQKGIALIAALCIIIVVGIISAFVCRVAVVSNKVANRGGTTLESRANAESALNAAYMSLAGRLDDLEDEARTAGVNTLADENKCSGNNREACLWWQYDTDSADRSKSVRGNSFNGWLSDEASETGEWHVFDLSKTVASSGSGAQSPFKSGEAVYRIEKTDDPVPSGDLCIQWFRLTARGIGYGGSRSYIQARVKVPQACKNSVGGGLEMPEGEPESKKVN